jgi:hypothetical protein
VTTPWVSSLDDDDQLLADHFESIFAVIGRQAPDVAYSFGTDAVGVDVTAWAPAELVRQLQRGNVVTSNATIRTELLRDAGGWSERGWDEERRCYRHTGAPFEDWDLWLRLARLGARFVCLPEITWRYRQGDWERESRPAR